MLHCRVCKSSGQLTQPTRHPTCTGGLVGELLKKQGAKFEYGTARLEDRAAILADFERVGAGQGGWAGAGAWG